jgi:hypothetical protein
MGDPRDTLATLQDAVIDRRRAEAGACRLRPRVIYQTG